MNADSKSAANNAPGSSANGSASSEKASTRSTPDGCSPFTISTFCCDKAPSIACVGRFIAVRLTYPGAPAAQRGHDDPLQYGPAGRSPWLDIDWREHQRWVVVDGQAVNTIELGSGPPVVFVHGLSGSWQNWLEQLPVVAAEHRVVALDLPGFGHSPLPAGEISIGGYARLLDGLLGALGVDAAAIVGNSMGGFIGAELAISSPERGERLVLVSAAGLSTFQEPRTVRAMPALRRLERILAANAAWVASKSETVARRRRLRNATMYLVARHPGRLPAP